VLAVRIRESVGPSGSLHGARSLERALPVRHGLEARLVMREARWGLGWG